MPRGYPLYVLAVMVAINFLNYMDRWVGSAVAPLIQKEFNIDDTRLGLLGTAFLLVYALAALPFGWWADRSVRRTIVAVGVAVWSLATVLTGFTRSFLQLFTTRAILGIGEAGYYPAGTSLLSDYFPKHTRGRAMSIWGAGSAFGIAVGFAGGGLVGERFGWRSAFFMAAIPGLILALLAFRLREPLRGAAEDRGPVLERPGDATFRAFFGLLRVPSLRAAILAQTALYFVLAGNAYWLPTVLHRRFDMSVSKAGLLSGVVIVLGGLIGTLAGGWLADWRSKKTPRANLEVGMAGFLLAAVFITIALLAPFAIFVPAFFLTVICLYLHSGPFTALGQNVVPPSLRAGSVTMLLVVAHVFGDSHAPFTIGFFSDSLRSLQVALLVVSPALLLVAAGAAYSGLASVGADMAASETEWATRPAEPVTA